MFTFTGDGKKYQQSSTLVLTHTASCPHHFQPQPRYPSSMHTRPPPEEPEGRADSGKGSSCQGLRQTHPPLPPSGPAFAGPRVARQPAANPEQQDPLPVPPTAVNPGTLLPGQVMEGRGRAPRHTATHLGPAAAFPEPAFPQTGGRPSAALP